MPRGRYRDDDGWSNDSSEFDDYRIREIAKRVSRSRSRHNHRSPQHEEPVINYFENKLYVPGQQPEQRPRSRSRGGSYSGERDSTTELLLAQLALDKRDNRSHDYEEDRYRQRYEDDRRRKEYEWEMEDARRKEEKRRDEMKREFEAESKRKDEEYKKALADAAEKDRQEKLKREKLAAELKAEEAKKKQEAKEQEERILLEAKLKAKEKEAEEEATEKRILAKVAAEEAKKKKEKEDKEKEFQQMLRERAIRQGQDPDKVALQYGTEKPKSHDRQVGLIQRAGVRRRVKVRRDHILPQTLDSYRLTWKYHEDNPEYIIIEDEVDDEFLFELQTDSERIIKSRKLITPGYKKETVTTLTPGGSTDSIRKKHGKYYMVRKRSVSRSRFGISDLI